MRGLFLLLVTNRNLSECIHFGVVSVLFPGSVETSIEDWDVGIWRGDLLTPHHSNGLSDDDPVLMELQYRDVLLCLLTRWPSLSCVGNVCLSNHQACREIQVLTSLASWYQSVKSCLWLPWPNTPASGQRQEGSSSTRNLLLQGVCEDSCPTLLAGVSSLVKSQQAQVVP